MASALVNSVGLVASEGFLDVPPSATPCSYGWLSPRISFSRDFQDDDPQPEAPAAARSPARKPAAVKSPSFPPLDGRPAEDTDLADFEFRRVDDPVAMLPADELFSDGKLVPLQMAPVRPPPESAASLPSAGGQSPDPPRESERAAEVPGSDPYAAFSPRPPRCASRWRELLGLKRAAQNAGGSKLDNHSHMLSSVRSLQHFLNRNRKSSSRDSSLSLPLLRDSDSDSAAICPRLSLSSSSSGPDHEDVPRLSLDSDKPGQISISLGRNPPKVRLPPKPCPSADPSPGPYRIGRSPMRSVPEDAVAIPARGASVDSPRMNSSGKVVFHGLERSSSSPSSFLGGPRVRHRGMERSYSANVVRVTPVLNVVPVCSLRGSSKAGSVFGLGQLFSSSPQKKDSSSGSSSSGAARNGGGAGRSGRTERS